jgi:hypothetical protein
MVDGNRLGFLPRRHHKYQWKIYSKKQFTGLCDAQTRQAQTLDFHFNASLSALNLAKYEDQLRSTKDHPKPSLSTFSMASYKRIAFNDHLLERFISMLDCPFA